MKREINYKGTFSSDQLDVLKKRLRSFERDPPLVFKGRDDIIQRLTDLLEDIKGGSNNTDRTLAYVIRGAPGSGKTSLIHELKNRFSEKGLGVKTINITGKDQKSKNEFVSAMLSREEITKLTVKTTEKGATGVNFLGLKGDLC